MFPSPIADPDAARMKPIRLPQFSLSLRPSLMTSILPMPVNFHLSMQESS